MNYLLTSSGKPSLALIMRRAHGWASKDRANYRATFVRELRKAWDTAKYEAAEEAQIRASADAYRAEAEALATKGRAAVNAVFDAAAAQSVTFHGNREHDRLLDLASRASAILATQTQARAA